MNYLDIEMWYYNISTYRLLCYGLSLPNVGASGLNLFYHSCMKKLSEFITEPNITKVLWLYALCYNFGKLKVLKRDTLEWMVSSNSVECHFGWSLKIQ